MITHALVRPPGASFARALSTSGVPIDVELAQRQHAEYRQALIAAGVRVTVLPPDDRYPDSCFVQDPALVIAGRGIIARPGAASRQGEEEALAEALMGCFPLTRIIPPGTLEGGDVLVLPDRVVVGRSGRTNRSGIAQLAAALNTPAPQGAGDPACLPLHEVPVRDYLHLLTVVTHLGDGLLLTVAGFELPPPLKGYHPLRVPEDEAYASNVLAVGTKVIMPAGYAKTAAMLRAHGFDVLPVPTTEFAKADGGVTCLALVW